MITEIITPRWVSTFHHSLARILNISIGSFPQQESQLLYIMRYLHWWKWNATSHSIRHTRSFSKVPDATKYIGKPEIISDP